MGLMGLAGKNMQEENRSLLKNIRAFDGPGKNQFINAPELKYQSTRTDYRVLQNIKAQRLKQAKKQSMLIKIGVLVFLPILMLLLWYLV